MSFGAPGYLWLLLLAPIVAALFVAWALWRSRARRAFGGASSTNALAIISAALIVLAMSVAALAAARPQIGERGVRTEQRGIDLVIVLDISQSMYSTDAQPSRIGRAQSEIIALLDRMQGDRVGLVIFAGRPFVRSPLTSDLVSLSRLVEGVDRERGLVPPGSDLGEAIRQAREVAEAGEARTKALLVISDGEDHGSSISGAVRDAADRGIRVYAAGVGTSQGAPVLDVDVATGQSVPRIGRDGLPVITRLDPLALRLIAESGGGQYIELSGNGRPLTGLAAELDALDATLFATEERPEPIDRFVIFAWAALAIAVAATVLPMLASRRSVKRPASLLRRVWPLAAGGLLIGAVCASDVIDVNRHGNEQYADGDYASAVDTYRTAEAIDPSRRELYHNASNALHQAQRITEAIDEAKRGLPADDPVLASKIEYALGNHYAAAERLSEALEAYKRALLANPDDEDAKHNLELIAKQLDATPSPTPSPTPPQVESTPTASGTGEPNNPGNEQGDGTPQPGEPSEEQGTPGAQGSPAAGEREMTPEEVQRALDEALRGIDQDFTVDEALRVLDLLEQQNRMQLQQPGDPGNSGAPDY